MKRLFPHIFTTLATVLLLTTSCSDDAADVPGASPSGGKALVTLRIMTADEAATRAEGSTYKYWKDGNAVATDRSEMMYSWHVIIVNSSGTVVFEKSNNDVSDDNAEIDIVAENVEMPTGTYTAYSFANMAKPSLTDIETATYTVNGNGFVPSDTNGIPMSNKQTFTVTGNMTKDLIVVRMLAKMEISIKNSTGAAVTVNSLTLSNITKNASGNLKLLPLYDTTNSNYTQGGVAAEDDMEARHGVLQPNVADGTETEDFTVNVKEKLAAGASTTKTFYINESKKPENAYGRFYLTVSTTNADGTHTENRYALIDDQNKSEADKGKWDYIARNDYRKIPVVLDDYRLDIIPYDFPPIGVYPCSVKDEDGLFTITFHDYGHFHLVPVVTKMSTGETVPFGGSTTPRWTLKSNDWATAWTSWADDKKTTALTDDGSFYVHQDTSAKKDADDNGGMPQWDATTSWNNMSPFIFGKIAEPEAKWWSLPTDKKVYHELTVEVNKDGGAKRELTARILMILDADQMLSRKGRTELR